MSNDYVACTFARPAGNRTDLAVLYVASGHHLEGETVICNLAPSQQWITQLGEGDIVHVRNRLHQGNRGDYLGDACANAKQPLFQEHYTETTYQPEIPTPPAPAVAEPALNGCGVRLDTYLSEPQHIAVLELLARHCSKKEAGHLLLKYAIKNLPPVTKHMDSPQLYDWLNNF